MTFRDISTNQLFVTGPARTVFIKINDEPWVGCLNGGTAIALDSGERAWVPAQRQVKYPTQTDFMVLGRRWRWDNQEILQKTS